MKEPKYPAIKLISEEEKERIKKENIYFDAFAIVLKRKSNEQLIQLYSNRDREKLEIYQELLLRGVID